MDVDAAAHSASAVPITLAMVTSQIPNQVSGISVNLQGSSWPGTTMPLPISTPKSLIFNRPAPVRALWFESCPSDLDQGKGIFSHPGLV